MKNHSFFKPKKLNRQSGEIIFCEIAMTSIEKPIEIGLQRVGNRYEAKFYCSRFSIEFFGLNFATIDGNSMMTLDTRTSTWLKLEQRNKDCLGNLLHYAI